MAILTRRNVVTRPTAEATTNYAAVAGTGGTAAITNVATGGQANEFSPRINRVTWSVATTAVSGGFTYTETTGITAGQPHVAQVWVRSSVAQTLNLALDFRTSSASVNVANSGPVPLVANTWTPIRVAGTAGALATRFTITVAATTGGLLWAVGNTLDVDAVMVEQVSGFDRTNLITNPSFETGTTGYTISNNMTPSTTSTAQKYVGTQSLALTRLNSTQGSGYIRYNMPVTAGKTYTVSFYVYGGAGQYSSRASGYSTIFWSAPGPTWTRISFTFTATSTNASLQMFLITDDPNLAPVAGTVLYVDAVQAEEALAPSTYFDGSMVGVGSQMLSWTGTAHASTSVEKIAQPFFTGSSTNSGATFYAWTGTVNASASTSTTYVPALTVNTFTDMAPCPRSEITVQDLYPGAANINVWRTADGRRQAVRGARRRSIIAADFLTDYEVPLGRPVTYELEVLDGPNVDAATPPVVVQVNSTVAVIQDPLVPTSALALSGTGDEPGIISLRGTALSKLSYKAGGTVLPILGRDLPVALLGTRMAAAGVPFDLVTDAAEESTQLRNLLRQTPLVLVRPLPSWGASPLPGLCYVSAQQVDELPQQGGWGTVTYWELTGDLVEAPTMAVVIPLWTYGDVQALWITYQQAQTVFAGKKYLDVLQSPSGV